jgi:hypothetical protein
MRAGVVVGVGVLVGGLAAGALFGVPHAPEGAAAPAEAVVPSIEAGEVTGLRSEHGSVLRLEDGSLRAVFSQQPVHFRDDRGLWEPIVTDLVEVEGGWRPRASGVVSTVPMSLAASPVRVAEGDRWVEFSLEGASDVGPSVSGPVATYPGAFEGVDAVYGVLASGVKEALVLRDPASVPDAVRYRVGLSDGLR